MIAKDKRIDLSTPIERLEFGDGYNLRVHHALHVYEIETVLDLCKTSRNAFLRLWNCGKKTVRAIEMTLSEYGLKLDMDDKSIDEYLNCPSFVLSDEEWENRRYAIAKEIYINKFSDYSIENAELALMAADDFIGVLRKYYQNKD